MRGVSLLLLTLFVCTTWIAPTAEAGLGSVLNGNDTGTGNSGSGDNNDDETDAYLNQLDQDYNNSVNTVNEQYSNSTNAINDGSYEAYTDKLDSTLEAMYNDINNGGTAAGMETAGSYTPPTVPGSNSGSSNTGTASGSGSGQAQAGAGQGSGSAATETSQPEDQPPSDPRIAMVLEICTPACTPSEGQFNQACASACARQVLGVAPEPSASDSMMLMSLLGE